MNLKIVIVLATIAPVLLIACKKHDLKGGVTNTNSAKIEKVKGTYNGTYTTWVRRLDTTGVARVDTGTAASILSVANIGGDSINITASFLKYMPQQNFLYSADNHYHTSIAAPHDVTLYDIYLYPDNDSVYVLITQENPGYGNGSYFNGTK